MYSTVSEDSQASVGWSEREEYRRWLVDCHKASYLPTCLSGGEENLLTAEPAVVIAESQNEGVQSENDIGSSFVNSDNGNQTSEQRTALLKRQKAQKGGNKYLNRL